MQSGQIAMSFAGKKVGAAQKREYGIPTSTPIFATSIDANCVGLVQRLRAPDHLQGEGSRSGSILETLPPVAFGPLFNW